MIAGYKQVKWLGTGALVVGLGYGLMLHPGAAIEEANAQMLMGTNIRASCELTAYTLEGLVECISDHMPAKNSGGYVLPSASVESDWRTLVEDLVAIDDIGDCDTISIPSSLIGIYEVFSFYDNYDGGEYCVAMEVDDGDDDGVADRGWGTLIVNPTPERYLSIDIPHPLEDDDTNIEGIAIFEGVGAHTFLMAGANREANSQTSSCQSGEKESDVAHSIDNLFFPAVVEIDQHFTSASLEHTAIQFHGMDADEGGCSGVGIYITHGSEDTPQSSDSIVALKDALLAEEPSWDDPGVPTVANPGQPGATCGKNGTNNVEGRYLNTGNESLVCGSDVDVYNGRFIHVEQDIDNDLTGYRNPKTWIAAIEDAFPPLSTPPTTSSISFQDGVAPSVAYNGTSDTYIRDGDGSEGSDDEVEVDGVDDGKQKWAALRWDVSSIPSGSTIDEVTVTIEVSNSTGSAGYYVYPLSRDWSEADATWDQYADSLYWQVPGASGALDREDVPVAHWAPRTTGTHTLSLNPDLVQSWLDFPSLNHGVLLVNEDNTNGLDFDSSEATPAANRPKLTVVYH